MVEFLSSFLASSSFIPHGHCYLWNPGLVWLNIISDSLIALAYYCIPITLGRFVQKYRDLPYVRVFLLFIAFIIACGTTHIMDVWTLWYPTYWLSGFLKALTALISVYTVIALIEIIPQALTLPSLAQLEAANYQLLAEVLERRLIEEELYSSKQMLQLVIDNIPQFIFWKDRNSVYLGCNLSFAHTAGLDNTLEIVDKTDDDLPWSSEESNYFRECDARVMATNTPEYHIIEHSLSADGKQHWKDTNRIPLHDLKGNVVGLLNSVEDITERKQAETVLQRLNEELEIRVSERTVALSESNRQLAAEIAERQSAEIALRRSEELYRSLIEATSQIIWDTSVEGEFVTEQLSWSAFTGQTIDEFRGWGWLNAIHPEDQPHTVQAWLQAVANGTFYEVEHRLRRYDGEYKYMSVRAVPVLETDTSIRQWVGVQTDITERKRAEEALLSSIATNRALLNAIPDLMFRLSRDGILVNYKAPKESEILFPDREFLGKNINEFLHKDTAQKVLQLIEQALETGELQVYEFHLPQMSNTTYWETRLVVSESNEVIAIVRDITQRKLAEEALRQSEQKFRTIVENANDIIYLLTINGIFSYVSPNWTNILGHDVKEVEGKSFNPFLHPDYVLPCQNFLQLVLTTGQKLSGVEYQIKHKNGSWKWHTSNVSVLKDSSDKVLYFIGICRDITERKQAEEEIAKALEKERELSELKSHFIAMTSHEFRTPLTTILSSAELLEDYSQNWSEEKKVEHLQRIQASGERMTHLLNDVLLLGKAEAGKLECRPDPLNLNKFCNNLVEELRLGSGNKHSIIFVQEGECTTACLDEKLLHPILSNLLSNAIKYSPTSITIQMTAICQKGEVIFKIEDFGIGIPPEDLQRLFDPFHRAKNVGTIPGTGLGMAIVKKCVDSHRGQISVKSEVGVGTIFTVTLPLNQ